MMWVPTKAVTRTTTGQLSVGTCRIKGVYFTAGATAGKVEIRDGSGSGTLRIDLNTPVGTASAPYILLPGDGVKFDADPHVTLTTATSATIFYG